MLKRYLRDTVNLSEEFTDVKLPEQLSLQDMTLNEQLKCIKANVSLSAGQDWIIKRMHYKGQ